MQGQDGLNTSEREFESALKSLSPAAARIDAVAAAFAAGQRSATRRARMVHSALAAVVLLAAGSWLAITDSNRHPPIHAAPLQISQTPPLPDQSMIALRRTVLEVGLDALPEVRVPGGQPIRVNQAM